MKLVIGLGNPGPQYQNSRHNFGFMVVDMLSEVHRIPVKKIGHKALWGKGTIAGNEVVLAKPQTYMNLSGQSALELTKHFGVDFHETIIIYDDMDLPLGKLRLRPFGGAGTHNGMRSIIYQLCTEDFPRVRLGIGSPPEGVDAADYVISPFAPEEKAQVFDVIKKAAEAVEVILASGIDEAMNRFN
jgi:PTH1 family peptidyl-tRNA hydrolase